MTKQQQTTLSNSEQATIKKILVVKLADLGDVLTATPALQALRQTYPQAQIDLLLTHHTRSVMQYSPLINTIISSDNFRFFSLKQALKLSLLKEAWAVLRKIRHPRYDAIIILHHLTTRFGALKYATIAKASGARIIAGLAPPGKRGKFLTHIAPDLGFGIRHEVTYCLDVVALLGATVFPPPSMELSISIEDEAWADLMLTVLKANNTTNKPNPIIIIHPGSGGFNPARRWAANYFATVADTLNQSGAQIILVGKAEDGTNLVQEKMSTTAIDLTNQTSLHQLAALLRRANLFIGGDSGVSHLAATCNIPMITIFGPTNATAWGPAGPKQIVLQAPLACSPCAYVHHQVGLRDGCEAKTCLKLITPQQVITVANSLLNPQKTTTSSSFKTILQTNNAPALQLPYSVTTILGVQIHVLNFKQALAQLEIFIKQNTPHQIVTVNPEFVVAAQTDHVFKQIINKASLSLPDGIGLLKASNWLNQPALPERIAGVDIVEALAALAAQNGYSIYFLGAQAGVAQQAATILSKRYPGLIIAGTYAGSPQADYEDEIVAKIQRANPDILFVAYGAPKQDKWIARNMHRLPASVSIGIGGAFDFIAGVTQRAPQWIQALHLEWLHRFIHQPWRWRRMWNAVPKFLWLIFLERIKNS